MTKPAEFPFKGIRSRPYDQALLPSFRSTKPIGDFLLRQIYLTQTIVNIMGLFGQKFSKDPYPHVVYWKDEWYLEDGHHRVILQALTDRSVTRIDCRIIYSDLDIPAIPNNWPDHCETPSE